MHSSHNQSQDQALDVLIVGAGFGGLYMLYRARRQGLRAQVVEAAPSVGGTWYHNRYPGARVDIQSLEYSFEFDDALQQAWRWTERYATAPELLRYANHVADRLALRDGIALNTRISGAEFDEATQRWKARAEDGRHWSARFMVMATGPLSAPNVPAFKGLSAFKGLVCHTADWPHEPVDFTGMRVGIIGTGSSGVQATPIIAQQAAQLTVFQRTAAYAVPAHNAPLDPAYEANIKADYAGFRARNLQMRGAFGGEVPPNPVSALAATPEEREAEYERRWQIGGFCLLGSFVDTMTDLRANALAAEFVRGKIRSIVHNPETARLLSPTQTIGCKRLCVDTGYYATFNQPHVQLVDISGSGDNGGSRIEEITADGVRAGGKHYPLDALVLATGFDAITGTMMRLDLRGRNGVTIRSKWADGPHNYLGLMVAGFPNMFNVAGAGSAAAFTNVIKSIEHHVDWIARCIAHLDATGRTTIEPTLQAEAGWMALLQAIAEQTVFLSCNSWYLGANIEGKPRMFMQMAAGFPMYAAKCADVAAKGYEGFVLA